MRQGSSPDGGSMKVLLSKRWLVQVSRSGEVQKILFFLEEERWRDSGRVVAVSQPCCCCRVSQRWRPEAKWFCESRAREQHPGHFQYVYFKRPQFLRSALLFPPATLNTA